MKKWLIAITIAVLFSMTVGFIVEKTILPFVNNKNNSVKQNEIVDQKYLVTRVIDGDTIKIIYNEEEVSVRLLGIDAPELNDKRELVSCFANESKNKLDEKIFNRRVELELDLSQGDKDRYGRLLRYVYLEGELINSWLVKEGYAHAYREYPVSKLKEFEDYENEARLNDRGLWNDNCK